MAYDEGLADRVRGVLSVKPDIAEKKMFGGIAFMASGHMFCGVLGDELVVRVGAEAGVEALRRKHTRPMDFTGRPMKGYVYVAPGGLDRESDLEDWVNLAMRFVHTLPAKKMAPSKRRGGSKPLS
jgi:TfoX/Sxy family transcriptional regulator of competence genes